MTMCDTVLADLSKPEKRIEAFSRAQNIRLSSGETGIVRGDEAADRCYRRIREATRYVITDDLLEYIVPVYSEIVNNRLLEAVIESRLPHQSMWIEWNEATRQKLLREWAEKQRYQVNFAPLEKITSNVGYLLLENDRPDKCSWLATPFSNGVSEGADKTIVAPLGFVVHPELDSPLAGKIKLEEHPGSSYSLYCLPVHEIDLEIANAAIGKGFLERQLVLSDRESFPDIYAAFSSLQTDASEWMPHNYSDRWSKNTENMIGSDGRFLACVLELLNYDWIVKDDIEPQGSPRRIRHGKQLPRHSHITLSIDLPKARGVTMLPVLPVEGASRRQHEVRGHWRRYRKSGKRAWVRAHRRGDVSLGIITKDYELTN